jgi:hypothetical protein
MNTQRSSTETLIKALRILSRDIESEDGVANTAISEAADRLEELHNSMQASDAVRTESLNEYHPAIVSACNAGKIKKMDGYFLRDATDRAKIQEAWEAQEAEFRRICLKSKEEQGEFGKNRTDTENWFSMTDLLIKIFNKNGEEGKDLCVDEIKCVMCFDKLQELRAMNAELQRVLGITHSFVAEITRAGGEYSYLDKTPIVADAYPILSGIESAIAKAQGTLISSDAKK